MTTLAYRDGVMAADSSCWDGGVNVHRLRKVYRVKGLLVGYTGDVGAFGRFLDWLKDGGYPDEYPKVKSLTVLAVSKDGAVKSFDESGPHVGHAAPYYAIGAGSAVALGAMFAGADAKTAVRAAVRHAEGTTAPVRMYRI